MIPVHLLIEIVCRQSNTTPHDLLYKSRKPEHYIPRFACFVLLMNHCRKSKHQIGELFSIEYQYVNKALQSIKKKQRNPFPDRYQMQLIELIEECNRIILTE